MNKAKGMSQTLALIVAASVLMMTALTVIFLAQGSLTDLGSNSDQQACLSSVQAQCSAALPSAGGQEVPISVPQTCIADEENLISGVSGSSGQIGSYRYDMPSDPSETITCTINN